MVSLRFCEKARESSDALFREPFGAGVLSDHSQLGSEDT